MSLKVGELDLELLVMLMPSGADSHYTVEADSRPSVDVAGAGSSCRAEADRRPTADVAGAGSSRRLRLTVVQVVTQA